MPRKRMSSVDKYEDDRNRLVLGIAKEFELSSKEIEQIAAPGTYACHEALTVLNFLHSAFSEEVTNHMAVICNRKWYILARQIEDLINDLKQDIAETHIPDEDEE